MPNMESECAQTNIDGDVDGPVLSGHLEGPVGAGTQAEAVDLRGAHQVIYKPTMLNQIALDTLASQGRGLVHILRVTGSSLLLGLLVSFALNLTVGGVRTNQLSDSRLIAASILHGALGAALGAVFSYYTFDLSSTLFRVGWVEGSIVVAEWVFSALFPASKALLLIWLLKTPFSAPVLTAFIGGPWLALITHAFLGLIVPKDRPSGNWVQQQYLPVLAGCIVPLLAAIAVGQMFVPSAPPMIVGQEWVRSGYRYIYAPYPMEYIPFVGILVGLAMILPAAIASRAKRPSIAVMRAAGMSVLLAFLLLTTAG